MMNPVDLKPYFNNPRHNDKAVQGIVQSIREFGFQVPIIVDIYNVIITGHTRYKAALLLDLSEVPVIIADNLSPVQAKAFRIRDNVSESTWDDEKLTLEFAELAELSFDLALTGFTFDLPLDQSAILQKNNETKNVETKNLSTSANKSEEDFFDIPDDLNVGMPAESNAGSGAKQTKVYSIKFGKNEIFTTEEEFNNFEKVLRLYLQKKSNDLFFIGWLIEDKLNELS